VLSIIAPFDKNETEILIEDYSFGSKGRVFHLAENCGLLKYLLYKNGWSYSTVAPTVIKKYATGKGNASKEKMYEAFRELTQLDIVDIYCSKTLGSPITDIVDSYYIAMYMWDSVQNNDTGKLNRGTNLGRKIDPKL
jgi:Holliday junction resolvasome RuvABC endonuclease subunit